MRIAFMRLTYKQTHIPIATVAQAGMDVIPPLGFRSVNAQRNKYKFCPERKYKVLTRYIYIHLLYRGSKVTYKLFTNDHKRR